MLSLKHLHSCKIIPLFAKDKNSSVIFKSNYVYVKMSIGAIRFVRNNQFLLQQHTFFPYSLIPLLILHNINFVNEATLILILIK